MDSLEARIGYTFKNVRLLHSALTHPGLGVRQREIGRTYQRLEFLGDAVVDLVISEELYHIFPEADEGLLSKLWTRAVQSSTMARIAQQWQFDRHLQLSGADERKGHRKREGTLADTLEAVIGAVHLDGGFPAAQQVILRLWLDELQALKRSPVELNPKGQLQELLQGGLKSETPLYRIVGENGPDHERRFEAVVCWKGRDLAAGRGFSKQQAEIAAAQAALNLPQLAFIIAEERAKDAACEGVTNNPVSKVEKLRKTAPHH